MNPSHHHQQHRCRSLPQPVSAWTLLQTERPSWPLFPSTSSSLSSSSSPSPLATPSYSQCHDLPQQQRQEMLLQQAQHEEVMLTPGITELAGPAGSGKTQLALRLCLQCASTPLPPSRQPQQHPQQQQLPQQQQYFHAIYLCMGQTSLRAQSKLAGRLEQMALAQTHGHQQDALVLLSRIWLRMVHNLDEFQELMDYDLPQQFFHDSNSTSNSNHQSNGSNSKCRNVVVGVLVLDSLANLVRSPQEIQAAAFALAATDEEETDSIPKWLPQRTHMLFQMAAQLQRWVDDFQLTVLVVNQATQSSASSTATTISHHHDKDGRSPPLRLQPALGLSWSRCINTSIWLTRHEGTTTYHQQQHDEQEQQQVLDVKLPVLQQPIPFTPDDQNIARLRSLQRHVTPDTSNTASPSSTPTTFLINSPWVRTAHVRFSPRLPPWSGSFVITTAGPMLIDNSKR